MGRPRGSKNRLSSIEKFHRNYVIDHETGCWNWCKSCSQYGYGWFRQDGHILAHRWSYATFCGEIPSGLFVLHRCDNPHCVNPEHLIVGTAAENSHDMVQKGRVYNKGKTFEEVFGAEKAIILRENLREYALTHPVPPEARARQAISMKMSWQRRKSACP